MIKRTGPVKSLLSILLTVSILFGITPLSAVSVPVVPETENVRQNPTEAFKAPDIIDAEEQAEKSYAGRVKEEEKDLYTFVFRNEDGSNTMRVFDHPVKYVDDKGETRDISLEISKDKDGSFKAADHMIKATFGNDLSEGIGLGYDGVRIKMTAKTVSGEKESVGLSSDGKKLTYAVDGKTSYVYSLTYCGIKEDIVVSEYTGQTEYEFTLNTNGTLRLADDKGTVKLVVGAEHVISIESAGNYVTVLYMQGERLMRYSLRNTMKGIEDACSQHSLIRCHRSYYLNLSRVRLLRRTTDGLVAEVDIEGVPNIPVSKSYANEVTQRFAERK